MKKLLHTLLVLFAIGVGYQTLTKKENMLSKETISSLAKAAGLSVEDLTKAISHEEEKSLDINVNHSFTDEEWETTTKNLKNEEYENGKTAGVEMLIKGWKQDHELDFSGKEPKIFIDSFKKKIIEDADKNPDKRVAELENDIKVLRETTLKEEQEKANRYQNELQAFKITSQISKYIPDQLPQGLTKDDATTIVMNSLDFSLDESGNQVVKKDGQVIKDKTRNNVSFKDAIVDFTTERNWRTGAGGRGNGDEPAGGGTITDHKKARKYSDLESIFEEKGISDKSQEARVMISEATKDAKDSKEEFDFSA